MFLHEFGEDFVLALQLLFQQGDPPVLVVAGAAGAVLECGSGVLEELLLPTVEHRGVNAVLVAQIRHRGVFEEMEPKYGDLLRGAEAIPSFLGHGKTSARDCSLFERLVLPIPTEAKQGSAAPACPRPAGRRGIERTWFRRRPRPVRRNRSDPRETHRSPTACCSRIRRDPWVSSCWKDAASSMTGTHTICGTRLRPLGRGRPPEHRRV